MKSVAVKKHAVFPQKGETLLTLITEGNLVSQLSIFPSDVAAGILAKAKKRDFQGKTNEILTYEWHGAYDTVILAGLGRKKNVTRRIVREAIAEATRVAASQKVQSMTLYPDLAGVASEGYIRALTLGFRLANHAFIKYKSEKERRKTHLVSTLELAFTGALPPRAEMEIEMAEAMAGGVIMARDLVNDPSSHAHPETLADEARAIAARSGGRIQVEILGEPELKKIGAGAFLAVAQGSERPARFIILHLAGKTPGAKKKPVFCFIGKSITFDSGGLSLKPAAHMEDMKTDMAGGAAVLGAFSILAALDRDPLYDMWGILPACENMPSGRAMRPGDVVTAVNGRTIEILNTDAEGRLALADALSYAEKFIKPDYIIDMATLTGACMVALGNDIAGVFGNNRSFTDAFMESARDQGEDAWELPLHEPYASLLKSKVADLKNISSSSYGGALTAALFLKEFVSKSKWIHVDIAGPSYRKEGKGSVPSGGTGFGLLTVINYVLDKSV